VQITEHQAYAAVCSCCGQRSRGAIPPSIAASVVGERLSALIGFLACRVRGTRRATEELLAEALGCPLSLGTVMARERELELALSEAYGQAQRHVRAAAAKNVDETGWKRAGRYLWLAATQTVALFQISKARNRHALEDLLGEQILGTLCTDRYSVYQYVPLDQRGVCWAHLRRDFQKCLERGGVCGELGRAALAIADAVHELWQRFKAGDLDRPGLQQAIVAPRQRMKALLEEGSERTEKKTRHFCRNLLKVEAAMWTFAFVEGIEPTNNHGERMLRPAVLWRKSSQGSQSKGGCRFVERMLTVVQTLRLQHRSVLDYLTRCIAAFRQGLAPPDLVI
jgi:transposase